LFLENGIWEVEEGENKIWVDGACIIILYVRQLYHNYFLVFVYSLNSTKKEKVNPYVVWSDIIVVPNIVNVVIVNHQSFDKGKGKTEMREGEVVVEKEEERERESTKYSPFLGPDGEWSMLKDPHSVLTNNKRPRRMFLSDAIEVWYNNNKNVFDNDV
jgi:hypothetical protein